MNADSAFVIGAAHAVCQDYARAGNNWPVALAANPGQSPSPYVMVSDGCSSSPDTDTGARLLVKAAEQALLAPVKLSVSAITEVHAEAARRALRWAKLMGLSPQAVDATLLTAHLSGDELIVGCSGDGVIVLESWSGVADVYVISFASGYPLYPCYAHQPERLHALRRSGRDGKEIKHFRRDAPGEALCLKRTSTSDAPTEVLATEAHAYRHAVIISDGVHSFSTETGGRAESVPLDDVLRELVAFKSGRGAFVGRRVNRFVKDCRRKGWRHADDLAIGALRLGG